MSKEKTGLGLLNKETFKSLFPYEGIEASYERALGALVIRFSFLGFLLEQFSHEVFAIGVQTATIVLNDLPFTRLIEKLRQCVPHRMPDKTDQKEFLSILKRAEQKANQRNELIHALWIINEGEPPFCYRRRNKLNRQAPSIDEINELNRSIRILTGDLIAFKKRQSLASPVELAPASLQENQPKP